MPPLDPDVADLVPSDQALTVYDEQHLVTYLCILDAKAEGAERREVSSIVLHIDAERESDRARRANDSHLARGHVHDGGRIQTVAARRDWGNDEQTSYFVCGFRLISFVLGLTSATFLIAPAVRLSGMVCRFADGTGPSPASRTQCTSSKLLIFLAVARVSVPFCSRSFHPIRCDFVAALPNENDAH
jgi:hypothetical protein